MTQTAEASPDPRPLVATVRAFAGAHALWIGVGAIAVAASAFLLAPADGLAPARGRDARALRRPRQPGGRRRARDPRSRRSATPLPLRLRRRPSRPRPRQPAPRLGSVRGREPAADRAARPTARRTLDGADRDGARRRQLGVPLPRRLCPDVQPVPVPLVAVVRPPAARTRPRRRGGLERSGAQRSCSPSPRIRTARSCSPPRALRARGAARPAPAGGDRLRCRGASSASRSGSPTSFSPAASTSGSAVTAPSSAARGRSSRTCGRRRATSAPAAGRSCRRPRCSRWSAS